MLLAIVPRRDAAGSAVVSETLIPCPARTLVVMLRTLNVPCPAPAALTFTAAWPALPLVKLLPVLRSKSNAALLPASTWMLSDTHAPANAGEPHVAVAVNVEFDTTTCVFPVPELNTVMLSLMSALLPLRVNVELLISTRSFSPGRSLVPSLFWIQMLNWPLSLVRFRPLNTLVRAAEATPFRSQR